ncbi:MAG TPA: PEP/pyruvate-binding domain-containing protein [Kofleriaceae bacterium]|nr:PEP/pyruvate-binding domain-containing protein [Kofleriaceae bacterium]
MSRARPLLAAAAVVAAVLQPATAAAQGEQRAYVRSIPDRATFERYARVIGSDRFGKFIIDVKTDDIYFIDVNLFKLHADFVLGVLLKLPWTEATVREYNLNYERVKPRFILGYLTEHLKIRRITFSFWEGDKIDAAGVARVKKRLDQTFFTKDLAFRPDSPLQEEVARAVKKKGIKTISNDEIYRAADYQAFNTGQTVGTLKVVPRGTRYESLVFDHSDVVILQEAYPDITPVAGILSTVFSTPLAHVNLRATAWGIPNAGFVHAFRDYSRLDGKVVLFEVGDRGHTLREATPEEVRAFQLRQETARKVDIPQAVITSPRLAMLTRIRARDVLRYGTKTANLGEIVTAAPPGVAVPAGFGVPFFYYVRHMRQNKLDQRVETMLTDPRWKDAAWRKAELESLQAAIRAAPIDPAVLDAIYKRVKLKLGGAGVFVRSSTNAEDLPGFNGAGLYDTVPNVRGKQALGDAMRQVWASVWNFRAVEERELFGIDHRKVYGAVLVQIGINASAAGVLVTDNLFNPEDTNSFTINAKWGLGIRVVEGTKIPEQIVFDTSNQGTRIISRSDEKTMLVFDEKGGIREVPTENAGVILTEERALRLATAVQAFIPLFPPTAPLDVEWLFEGEKVWIVQARPYVTKPQRR